MIHRLAQYSYWIFGHALMKLILHARVEVNMPSAEASSRPLLLVANHDSVADPFLLVLLPWKIVRRLAPFAFPTGAYLARSRWWPLFSLLGAYRLPRIAWRVEDFLDPTLERLRDNQTVLLFPEGEIAPDPKSRSARRGAGYLIQKVDGFVAPLRIVGASQLELGKLWNRSITIELSLGAALSTSRFHAMTPADAAEALLRLVEDEGSMCFKTGQKSS